MKIRLRHPLFYHLLLPLVSWLAFTNMSFSQQIMNQGTSTTDKINSAAEIGFKHGSIIVAPVPFENPAIGSGLALGGAYLSKIDEGSSTSAIGGGGFKSDNGSEGYVLGSNLNFDSDRWQTTFLMGNFDLNYDLFVRGTPVPLTQSVKVVSAKVLYGATPDFAFGGALSYAKSTIGPDGGAILPPSLTPQLDLEILRIGVVGEFDQRDNTYYPTSGILASGELSYGIVTGGIIRSHERDYAKAVVKASHYSPLFREGVFAWQAVGCAASDEAPFFDACSLGGTDGFRGFSPTEFIDDALFSVQAEYRGRISRRLGYVMFVGAGSIGDNLGDALTSDYLVAGGIGARIRLSKKFPLDYAIDVSLDDRGENTLYVSVGQRF